MFKSPRTARVASVAAIVTAVVIFLGMLIFGGSSKANAVSYNPFKATITTSFSGSTAVQLVNRSAQEVGFEVGIDGMYRTVMVKPHRRNSVVYGLNPGIIVSVNYPYDSNLRISATTPTAITGDTSLRFKQPHPGLLKAKMVSSNGGNTLINFTMKYRGKTTRIGGAVTTGEQRSNTYLFGRLPKGALIIAANHSGVFDIVQVG